MPRGPSDSGKLTINLGSFEGGESIDFKNGVASAFYKSEGLDFRSKSSQMSVLPGATALAGASAILVDLPVEMVQDPTGTRWILGDAGNIYKLDTANILTKVATMTDGSGYGMAYNQLSDMLYITGQQTVSMYGPLTSGSPALKDQQFGKSASTANGVVNLFQTTTNNWDGTARNGAQSVGLTQGLPSVGSAPATAGQQYTCLNVISEATVDRCVFSPDIEPFYSIGINVSTKGTGNLILVLHDGFNRALATVTIPNGSITAGARNEFIFPAPGIRSFTGAIQSGLSAAYHFHVYSSVAADTMKLATVTANDMNTVDFVLMVSRLVKTNNGWHPATIFTGNGFMLCIGNGQYLSTYNFSNDQNPSNNVWQRLRFPIDAGFEVCGLSVNNQYLVIAAEKRSNNTNRNFQEGCLYFWDGQNATYNFKIQLPMGAPYSVYTFNNITYFICAGALYAWGGGQQVIKVRPIAYQNTDYLNATDTTIANPNMMAPRFNLLMIGYPSFTTNINIKYGVYTWGSVELIYPNSFGYSYRLSHATYFKDATNNLQIGMIKNFVDTLYMASRKTVAGTTTFYLDVIDNTSKAAPYFEFDTLTYDGGVRYKQKEFCRYKVNFLPWPTGAVLNVWYSIDRGPQVAADPITAVAYSPGVGDTSIVIDIPNGRFYEGQWGFYGTTNNPSSVPTFTGVTMEIDPLQSEADLRSDDKNEGG